MDFTNKIWNAARFTLMNGDKTTEVLPFLDRPLIDRWVLTRLNRVTESVNTCLEDYRFDKATSQLYHFTWHEYCDWYLELIKPVLQGDDTQEARATRHTLLESFEILQRLLHPFMPFLTEEIWQAIPHRGESIVIQSYPISQSDWLDTKAEESFRIIEQVVTIVRTGRALLEYGPSKKLWLYATAKDIDGVSNLQKLSPFLEYLGRGTFSVKDQDDWPTDQVLCLVVGIFTIGIQIEGDIDLNKALNRVHKQTQTKQKEASRLQERLESSNFAEKASQEVFQESSDRLEALTAELSLLSSSELQLQKMV